MDVFVGYLIDFLDLIEYNRCVELSLKLPEWEQESFALAGILTFTDKVIDETTKRYIKEVLSMTQVGRMLMEEGRKEGVYTMISA